mmetsp:Transcript_17222/g.48294  ORF Transcript_17222/g.48294 Transcript_17222/m.48294 type:complete len:92 (-) Transcript_17222:34-309(-)
MHASAKSLKATLAWIHLGRARPHLPPASGQAHGDAGHFFALYIRAMSLGTEMHLLGDAALAASKRTTVPKRVKESDWTGAVGKMYPVEFSS